MRILNVFQTYAILGKDKQASKIKVVSQYLARRGHHVEVLAVDYDRRFGAYVDDAEELRINYVGAWLKARNISLSLDAIPFFARRARDFNVVHLYGLYDMLGVYLATFCRRFSVPYVVEPMGMFVPIVRSVAVKRAWHAAFGGLVTGGAAKLIATSPQEVEEVASQGIARERIVLRANGLDLAEFRQLPPRGRFRAEAGIPEHAPLVLYFGRLAKKKGLDLLTKAFAALPTAVHLAIVGPDERDGTVAEIERLRQDLALGDRVHVAGARFGAARLEAFVDADVFVLPSINENFGNVAAESVACGVPVVVTDTCGIAPLLKDRVARVVPYEQRALSAAISEVLFDESSRAKLRAACPAVTAELSWDEKITEMERLYESLIREAARSTHH